MSKIIKPDICVIGGGSGGLSVAAAAAAFGVEVVLVEKARMGGDCLNYGCVPSKALIAAGKHAQSMRRSGAFGIGAAEPTIDFRKVHDHIHGVIGQIAPNDSVERFTALGVRVIQAEARFIDKRTLQAGDHEIRARRFVLATGSSPTIPDIEGLDTVDYLTNETIFDLTRRPGRLIVLGGGPIGVELAQAYGRLGSQVTLVEADEILGREDCEAVAVVRHALVEEGIDLREGSRLTMVQRRGKTGVRVTVEGAGGASEILDATHLLIASGRKPKLDGLGLEAAGIAVTDRGIKVDDAMRTGNRRVYAIGDVAGGAQFTHLANYHAGLVIRSILFRLPVRKNDRIIPRATFTDPEIAHIGLTEEEARAGRKTLSILRWPLSENDRARTERRTAGFVKLVADAKGNILGVSIVGANASELIGMWALAVERRLRLRDMVGYVPAYPTMGEIGKRATMTYFADMARKPAVRSLIRFLRVFG